jgi:hypothetical protein
MITFSFAIAPPFQSEFLKDLISDPGVLVKLEEVRKTLWERIKELEIEI